MSKKRVVIKGRFRIETDYPQLLRGYAFDEFRLNFMQRLNNQEINAIPVHARISVTQMTQKLEKVKDKGRFE